MIKGSTWFLEVNSLAESGDFYGQLGLELERVTSSQSLPWRHCALVD